MKLSAIPPGTLLWCIGLFLPASALAVEVRHDGPVRAVAWSADGKRLASGDDTGIVRVVETAAGKEVARFNVGGAVTGVAFSPNGEVLGVKSGGDGPLSTWDLKTGNRLKQLAFKSYTCSHLAFTPDGNTLVAAGPGEHMIWHHSKGGGFGSRSGKVAEGTSAAAAPNGSIVAWSTPTGGAMLFFPDARKNQRLELGPLTAFVFSPDAAQVAIATPDKTIRLRTLAGEEVRTFEGLREPATMLHLSGNGKILAAAAGADATVRLWDVATGRLRRRLSTGPGVQALALAPDGLRVALAVKDRVTIWNVATRELGDLGEPKPLEESDLKAAWEDLANGDPVRSENAFRRLAGARHHALKFLKSQLRAIAVPPLDMERVEQLIKDLTHPTYAARERASKELVKHGELIRPALEKYLAGKPTLEGHRRASLLLAEVQEAGLTPDRLRCLDAIEILEILRTPQSQAILEEIAGDALLSQIRLAARDALDRLARPEEKDKTK